MAEVHEDCVSRLGVADPAPVPVVPQGAPPVLMPTAARVSVTDAFDFAPKALELARMLAESDMVPKQYIGKPGNIIVAIQWGAEVDLKPMQSLASIAVINGKPGLYGDVGKAILQSKGCLIFEWDTKKIESMGYAECTIRRNGRPDVTRTFSKDDAVRAKLWGKDGPWQTYPYRQMAWRAFWFAARDAAADLLRGMPGVEELIDMPTERDITPVAAPADAPRPSRSDAVRDRLAKVTVEDVVKAFDEAKDLDAGNDAIEKAKKLKSPEDQAKANAAYHRFVQRIRGKGAVHEGSATTVDTETGEVTKSAAPSVQDVRAAISKATREKNVDDLDVAGSMIDGIDAPEDVKAALKADYASGKAALAGAA